MLNFIFASFLFYYIQTPVAEMREKPSKDSEIVSQAYFSEQVDLLDEKGDWVKIETAIDHYKGWTEKKAIFQRKDRYPMDGSTIAKVNRLSAHIYHVQDTIYGPILTLPFESKLEVLEPKEESTSRWIKISLPDGQIGYIQRGDVNLQPRSLTKEEMCALSLRFLNLPYTWGGRSSFGYDCSGFVQMLYRQMAIFIPRDSKDQLAWKGFTPASIDNVQPGDLIFFGLDEEKIRHVGMYLGNNQFIHSTVGENAPYIRISHLDNPEWNGEGRYPFRTFVRLKS